MGWFKEQLELRREIDNENLEESIDAITAAVIGKRIASSLSDNEALHTAIESVLKYYNCKIPKDKIPANIKTTEEQIEYRMRPYGISYRNVTLEKGWYKHAVGIMIGTMKSDGSLVVLTPGKFAGYCYLDPATGEKKKINRKTEELLDEKAICFYQPLPLSSIGVKDLVLFMIKQISTSDIILYVCVLLLSTGLGLLSTVFVDLLFGEVLQLKSVTILLSLANFMLCYTISKFLIDASNNLASNRILTKINVAVEAAVMNRMLNLPVKFYREYSSGELSQRSGYVQSLCSLMVQTAVSVSTSIVYLISYSAQMFDYGPKLVLPAVAGILITALVNTVTVFAQVKSTKKVMLCSTKTSGLTYSTITGIQKIKLAGAEKRMYSRWARLYAEEASELYNPPVFLKLSSTITLAVSLLSTLIIYYIAVKNVYGVNDYYAFMNAYGMIMGAFTTITTTVSSIANIRPILDMTKPILKTVPEIDEAKKEITALNGGIELSNLCFAYDDGQDDVIHNLSLKINPKEYVAIVGSTGCGKSTLIRLLLGFEKAQKGTIYYDNEDMATLDLRSLRRLIGTVMQDGKLFNGDIYSNIVISAPQLGLDDAWKAAEIAAIADDIRKMPMGMNTVISEGQGGISGGQRQRLMIARAVAPNPKILIFDEATSALDNITQKRVTEAIDSLGCTRIVVAHRLSTIKHADRIIYLDKGSIAEEGTYDELIAKDGLFAALVKRQRLDADCD